MRKILIVPDVLQLELGGSFLDRRSFKVRAATSAEEALAIATAWKPALIMFASTLPDMSATVFTRTVNERPELRDTRLLMVTMEIGREPEPPMAEPPDAHLVQPIDQAQLLESVGVLLNVEVRRGDRVRVELLAQVESTVEGDDDPQQMMANVLTLSPSGMLIECERHLKVGAMSSVQFFLPASSERITASCIVLYADELLLHYGVEFVDVSDAARARIAAFVAEVGGGVM